MSNTEDIRQHHTCQHVHYGSHTAGVSNLQGNMQQSAAVHSYHCCGHCCASCCSTDGSCHNQDLLPTAAVPVWMCVCPQNPTPAADCCCWYCCVRNEQPLCHWLSSCNSISLPFAPIITPIDSLKVTLPEPAAAKLLLLPTRCVSNKPRQTCQQL